MAQLHNIAEKHRPKDYQGIIRCRAGVGKQGRPRGDGKPVGPDRPLGKGVGGIKKERAERQRLAQRPNTKKRESSDERLKTLPKNGSFLLSHLVWQYHRR